MSASHHNNFDFIRFAAATMVWYGHCYALYGHPPASPIPFFPAEEFGTLGVAIFFIISGYFVTQSYVMHSRLLPYLRNRLLRILPALVVVVLLCVFLLGPLVTSLGMHDYFSRPETWRYLRSLLIFPLQHNLPGVFEDNKMSAVNGSLWTLQHEARCYGFVALLGVLGILLPRPVFILFALLWSFRIYGTLANIHMVPPLPFFGRWSWGKLQLAAQLEILFTSGALLYLARAHIPLTKECFAFACLLLAVSFGMQNNGSTALAGKLLLDFVLPYIVIYLGFLRLPMLHSFGVNGDFSYGMYLYAFPVQQLILHVWRHMDFTDFMAASFAVTLACAVASWHFVEKAALALKR